MYRRRTRVILWLASYPRSGNTFVRVLLKHLYGVRTYSMYDDPLFAEHRQVADAVGHAPRPLSMDEMASSAETYFVKTHDLPFADDFPALYLVRDGRDALVSYAHYILSFERGKEPADEGPPFNHVLRDLIVRNASFGGWGPNVLAWARDRSAPTRVVRFERLIREPVSTLTEALEGIGYGPRSAESGSAPTFATLHELMPAFFRRGRVGTWREEMPSELHDLFWEHHGEAMEAAGYQKAEADRAVP